MSVGIAVSYRPNDHDSERLRVILCDQSRRETTDGGGPSTYNPLIETNFNAVLQSIAQAAFDEGRKFQMKHPKLTG